MDEILGKFSRLIQAAVHRIHVRSALNPMLWLCGISTPCLLLGAYAFRDYELIRNGLVIASLIPIVVACLSFIGFAILNPARLQSEDYQIRHESLQLIQEKGGRIKVLNASVEAIANPESPRLSPPRNRDLQ